MATMDGVFCMYIQTSYVLHIASRKDPHGPIEFPLPPFCVVLVYDLDDISWDDIQFVRLVGLVLVQHSALSHNYMYKKYNA